MRRRVRRFAAHVGLLAPAVVALAGLAQAMPAGKDDRDREAGRAQARILPTPSEMAPADPVAAAFGLFPGTRAERREEVGLADDPTRVETVPMPAPVTEIEPGVVAVERVAPPVLVAPPAAAEPPALEPTAPPLGFAAASEGEPVAAERVLAPPIAAARTLNVPLPRRRPADLGAGDTPMRLASLTPEPPREVAREAAPIAAETVLAGEPKKIPKEALPYLEVMRREAAANKVPLWLAVGVGWVESKYNPRLRGTHGVVGLMQVMPSTARFQGYKGPTEKLLDPETNIVWGMRELGWDWAKSGGNPCLAIAKYKGGIATTRISAAAADYCRKAKTVTGMM